MKLAVTSSGESASSRVDPRFGRAAFFLIHDSDTGGWLVLDNTGDSRAGHGAGIHAAQRIVDQGARVLITGDCGPKASEVLKAAGIAIYQGFTGTVEEAVAAYTSGILAKSEMTDPESGHGTT
jgi:predicted Fe-Mo cluster-binding NifX family protein